MAANHVVIVGTGARKHALVRRLLDEGCTDLWVAPGNPAFDSLPVGQAPVGTESLPALVDWARGQAIDLAIVLNETLLFQGVADQFRRAGIACLGPGRAAALIERSKILAKNVMQRVGVRTPRWQIFSNARAAWEECRHFRYPAVIKIDGPPKHNNVFIVKGVDDARQALEWLGEYELGPAPVLVESVVDGPELSLTVLTDGRGGLALFPLVHEYRWTAAGNRGLMTRGMGAFAPVHLDDRALQGILDGVDRVLEELRRDGLVYTGALTANVILGPDGPELLEFNSHLGDPETQTVLPVMDHPLLDVLDATARGDLGGFIDLRQSVRSSSLSLSMVRKGYPGSPMDDVLIPEELALNVQVSFYETRRVGGGLVPVKGRALSCNAVAPTFDEAADRVHALAADIAMRVPGLTFREDIGTVEDTMRRHAGAGAGGFR